MPKDYPVKRGECLASISFENGLFWETVWNHDNNRGLRETRSSPHILLEGDVVHVPDRCPKEVECALGRTHQFRRKGVPEVLSLSFLDNGKARAGVPYTLIVDGVEIQGATNGGGGLRHFVSPVAKQGELILRPEGLPEERYELLFRQLDPASVTTGLQSRLKNLGLFDGEIDGVLSAATKAALCLFQRRENLTETGEPGPETLAALTRVHGS